MSAEWSLRPSTASDAGWMAELRAEVLRPDLERLGRWDATRVRERFLTAFDAARTWVVQVDGADAGLVAVRHEEDAHWLEHFYLQPRHQGRGLGTAVMAHLMNAHRDQRPFRLNVLQGSPARRLYERHGFTLEHEDAVDVFLIAPPVAGETPPSVRPR